MRAALILALAACGDNSVPITARPQSGSRLQLEVLAFEDGTRQLASSTTVFDAERGERCTITRWSDGLRYCTPAAHTAVYVDAECTIEVGRIRDGDPVSPYALHEFFVAGEVLPSKLYATGEPIEAAVDNTFELRGDSCLSRPDFSGLDTYVALGAEIEKSELVHTRRFELPTGDRLDTIVDTSPDGLQLPAELFDVELGLPCAPFRVGADTVECQLTGPEVGFSSAFADAACTEPVVVVSAAFTPPTITARTSEDRDFCLSFHPLTALLSASTTFTKSGTVCTEIPLDLGNRVFAAGPAHELATLERHRIATERRLETIEDGAHGFPERFLFDTEQARECSAVEIDGVTRCVPPFTAGAIRYADPLCLEPLLVAALRPRCGLPFELVEHPTEHTLHAVAEPMPAIYDLTTGDRCVEAVPFDGVTFYRVGEAIPPSAFPAATLEVD